MDDQKEAWLRYMQGTRAHIITPEEERRTALLQMNIPPEKRYSASQLQNAYWSGPQEVTEAAKAFIDEQIKKKTPSLIGWIKGVLSRWRA